MYHFKSSKEEARKRTFIPRIFDYGHMTIEHHRTKEKGPPKKKMNLPVFDDTLLDRTIERVNWIVDKVYNKDTQKVSLIRDLEKVRFKN